MKSKFFFVMSVAATMLLASCGGNSSSSQTGSNPKDSSAAGTSAADTSAVAPKVISLTCTPEKTDVEIGKTLTLKPVITVEGGASKVVTYATSNKDIATVSEGGVVTGVSAGEVTITIAAQADPSVKCEVKLNVIAEQVASIKDLENGKSYVVKGKVVAVNTKSYVIDDGTGAIMVYLNAEPTYEIGDVVKVDGKVSSGKYSAGMIQFDSSATSEKVEGSITPTAAVELTAEIVNGWKTAYEAAEDKEGAYFGTTDMKFYSWDTVAEKSGSYDVTKVDGSDVVIEPVYADTSVYSLTEGKRYHVEGYFAGYRVSSTSGAYAQYVITSAVEKEAEDGDITLATEDEDKKITVGDSMVVTASIHNGGDAVVSWTIAEDGSTVASLAVDTVDGNKVTVTGNAIGEITLVASFNGKSAQMKIVVESAAVAKKLNAVELNDIVIVDVAVIAEANNGYVVADDTQAAFVYDKTNKPAVGTHLSLTAKVGSYNGGLQLTPETDGYVVAQGAAPAAIAPVAMTEALGADALDAVRAAKTNSALPDLTKVGLYTFENVLVGGSSYYMTWEVGNVHFETNNTADANRPEAGKHYNITGLAYGYYNDTKKSIEYVTVVVTGLEEVAGGEEQSTSQGGQSTVPVESNSEAQEGWTAALLTAGNQAYDCTVNNIDGLKLGSSSKNGNLTITVGAGATKLGMHIAAWSNTSDASVTLSADGITIETASFTPISNSGISGSKSAYVLANAEPSEFYLETNLSNVSSDTIITLSAIKRVVVWDVSYFVA